MKSKFKLLLLPLLASMVLCACDDGGGFSMSHNVDNSTDKDSSNNDNKDNNDSGNHSGGTNVNEDPNNNLEGDPSEQQTNTEPAGGGSSTQTETIPTIRNFSIKFINFDENGYVCVSYEDDPFLEQYDFSYYTVNNSAQKTSVYIKEAKTYKLKFENKEEGSYTIEFYNSKSIQYGKSSIVVINQKERQVNTSFVAVSIEVIQAQIVSVGYVIIAQFKKIGEWIKSLFTGEGSYSISIGGR